MVSFAVAAKAIKQVVQPENVDLLLMAKHRNLFKIRKHGTSVNAQLKIKHFKFPIPFYLFYMNFPKPLIKSYIGGSPPIERREQGLCHYYIGDILA